MELSSGCPEYADNPMCGLRVAYEALESGVALVGGQYCVVATDEPLPGGIYLRDALVGLRSENNGPTLWPTAVLGCTSCLHNVLLTEEPDGQFARHTD
jgi:hypothetical protein